MHIEPKPLYNNWDDEDTRLTDPDLLRVDDMTLRQCRRELRRRKAAQGLFKGYISRAFNDRMIEFLQERIDILEEEQS